MTAKRLTPDGKPMRALRVLASSSDTPLTELDVWRLAKSGHKDWSWHAPLGTLVREGLAERSGSRGAYRWIITPEGMAILGEPNSRP